ncbi:Transcription factor domain, fungi [Phaffia rhodozyma]|uniref:Transcription factor domain, fungi n=1 Tax=Phaffia rhodozyma TaxID=264483 RepID=A0A0F7SLY2_PHARH|nr:Transcription factor domain, fungi [Phaffia rhodozyma]
MAKYEHDQFSTSAPLPWDIQKQLENLLQQQQQQQQQPSDPAYTQPQPYQQQQQQQQRQQQQQQNPPQLHQSSSSSRSYPSSSNEHVHQQQEVSYEDHDQQNQSSLYEQWVAFNVSDPSSSTDLSNQSQHQNQNESVRPLRTYSSAEHNPAQSPPPPPPGPQDPDGAPGSSSIGGGRAMLQVPFFRWFGRTSYTGTGFKRVKVELRNSTDLEQPTTPPVETVPLVGPSGSSPHAPAGPASNMLYPEFSPSASTPSSYSSPEDPLRPAPSVDTARSGSSSTATNTSDGKRKSTARDRLFKGEGKGRLGVYPKDEIFGDLLGIFERDLSCHFPFLSVASILEQHRANTLPALISNAICALTSRFSTHPLLLPLRASPKRQYESAQPFEDTAKKILVPLLSFPSVDTVVGLVLLAWSEFGSGRDSGLWMFSGMAIRMLQDLGLHREASIQQEPSDVEIARRRLLFWSVFFLDRVISYGTGRSATVSEAEIDIRSPTSADCELVAGQLQGPAGSVTPWPWPELIAITRFRGRISDVLNSPKGALDRSSREKLEVLQGDMISFYQAMDPVLHFSIHTFKHYRDLRQSPTFFLLHIMFHSVITVLHRPSLLQNFSQGEEVLLESNVEVSRSSARTLANMLSYADLAGSIAILANPFADQMIFVSAVAFLEERQLIEEAKNAAARAIASQRGLYQGGLNGMSSFSGAANGFGGAGGMDGFKTPTATKLLRSFADSKLDVSVSALKNCQFLWAGVGWVSRTIDQKRRGISIADVDPDTEADTPPVLFPKDPSMIRAWLQREWISRSAGSKQEDQTPFMKDEGVWDENMFSLVPSDVGLSFTGTGLDGSNQLIMSLDTVSDPMSYSEYGYTPGQDGQQGPGQTQEHGHKWDLPFDQPISVDHSGLPSPSFLNDLIWG